MTTIGEELRCMLGKGYVAPLVSGVELTAERKREILDSTETNAALARKHSTNSTRIANIRNEEK